jgi:hypothetical protein
MPEASGVGTVVLDIGGEVGAAAIFVPAELAGDEIEIRRLDEPWCGTHVAVRERTLPDGAVWAALFPALTAGRYEIRIKAGDPDGPTGTFEVTGGQVSNEHWPA